MELSWIFTKTSSEKYLYRRKSIYRKSIDYYVPTEPMIIHDSIIESIPYRLQIREMLW